MRHPQDWGTEWVIPHRVMEGASSLESYLHCSGPTHLTPRQRLEAQSTGRSVKSMNEACLALCCR